MGGKRKLTACWWLVTLPCETKLRTAHGNSLLNRQPHLPNFYCLLKKDPELAMYVLHVDVSFA